MSVASLAIAATSSVTNLLNSSEDIDITSDPSSRNRFCSSALVRVLRNVCDSFWTTSFGVPAGAKRPHPQVEAVRHAQFRIVGTSGRTSRRLRRRDPSAFRRPSRIMEAPVPYASKSMPRAHLISRATPPNCPCTVRAAGSRRPAERTTPRRSGSCSRYRPTRRSACRGSTWRARSDRSTILSGSVGPHDQQERGARHRPDADEVLCDVISRILTYRLAGSQSY